MVALGFLSKYMCIYMQLKKKFTLFNQKYRNCTSWNDREYIVIKFVNKKLQTVIVGSQIAAQTQKNWVISPISPIQ